MTEGILSKSNSLILKGGGILLMLIHHLFYSDWSQHYYDDITFHGHGVINEIGIFCKLCVAVFVFASGYGLAVSTPKDSLLKDFYLRRFKKLYLNYWYIWLLFVPISIFVFGRSFTDAYGDNVVLKGVLDFFGLLKMFGVDSYNPTWWFYNCIIILYLLFPLLNKWLFKNTYLLVSVSITCGLMSFIPGVNVISGYLFVFLIGMLMAKMPVQWVNDTKWWQIMIALLMLSLWRLTKICPTQIADGMLCVGIALMVYKIKWNKWVEKLMASLGEHSMNMFLTHTFIFYFWFSKYIYITRNPLLIFLSLLVSSYLLSVLIEWTKRNVGFYKISNFGWLTQSH